MYKYQELFENKDSILSWSFDVVSVYDAFRKIFLLALDKDVNLFHELTWNNFVRNSNFGVVLNKYIFYLMKYLTDQKYLGDNETIKDSLSKAKNYFATDSSSYEVNSKKEDILEQAKNIFKLAKLDGDAKDIVLLVESFELFQNEDFKTKLQKTSFQLEPFNGCDIPW